MKSRSHRLPIPIPIPLPPDDWVDESWTVDCVCGVNFDDGEEMVNCDECGVWVHTRCSRYVKTKKLFACHNCKANKIRRIDNTEETEVAQLLVELPTKTLRMDNPLPLPLPLPLSVPPPTPLKLSTDIPMEHKVHVQGLPAGDPSLFRGPSSVFNPQLWKCSGYVPKHFNFQYREFPCWDEKPEDSHKGVEDSENPANNGAGVLFSLSKENVLSSSQATIGYLKKQVGGVPCDTLAPPKDTKKQEIEDFDVKHPENGLKRERSLQKPIVIHSGKRKKEDSGTLKELSEKKKAKVVDRERDSKKRAAHSSRSVSTSSNDAKQLEVYESRGHKVFKSNPQGSKSGNPKENVHAHPLSDDCLVVDNNFGKSKNDLSCGGKPEEMSSSDAQKHASSFEAKYMEVNDGYQVPLKVENSPQPKRFMVSSLEHHDIKVTPMKDEGVVGDAANAVNASGSCPSTSEGIEALVEDMAASVIAAPIPEVKDTRHFQNSKDENFDVKLEKGLDSSRETFRAKTSPTGDVKLDTPRPLVPHSGVPADLSTATVEANDAAITGSQLRDENMQDVNKNMVVVGSQANKADDESPGEPCQPKHLAGSESLVVLKSSSELKHGPIPIERPSLPSGIVISASQRKMVVSVGKSSPSSSTIKISKSYVSGKGRSAKNTENHTSCAKQKAASDSDFSVRKDNTSTDVVRDGDGLERPKKIAKEHPKSSVASIQKASHSNKFSHAPVPKRTFSDSKDPAMQSSKTSSLQNAAATSDSAESGSLLVDSVQHIQEKITTSSLPLKGDKMNPSTGQTTSKVSQMQPLHPLVATNSPATLSDEELALLLHQELNSSPRVPRVPRMRHAGSLPQLASPTATSVLMKRTSSSGGKDHGLVSRRKNKDLMKDGSHISRERDDAAKKVDRVPLSSQRRHDSAEKGSAKGFHPVDKSLPPASTSVSSGPTSSNEANEQNMSSTRNSPQTASDDTGTVGRPTRTLPGLIAEIMSKGKRMAYEELCNAVLPHWPNLRKQNGERYAYSSHSQAVLDCLRNRSEWARLVDRGPKTNASRKRRKLDADTQNCESEDNDYSKDINSKEMESNSFESSLPKKGKRKARKRRRLALQGRGIKDVRRRRKVSDDDDDSSSSSSSEESMLSDDELQGSGTCPVVSEASASSDEAGTMS